MRFDHQKAFPYPVLRPDIDDYEGGAFQVGVQFVGSENKKNITAKINVALSVEEIKAEIARGNAAISIIIQCRETYFRQVISSKKYEIEQSFDSGVFRGEVIVSPYIVVKRPIAKFRCREINPEFSSKEFSFNVGDVLAADEPKIVYIDRELFKPISSILQLVKQENLTGYDWQLRFDEHKIQALLSAEAKDVIDRARNKRSNRMILLNSIYFAAIVEAIHKLREDEVSYEDRRWAKVLTQQCHNAGIDLKTHEACEIAQRLLKSPLALLKEFVFGEDEK